MHKQIFLSLLTLFLAIAAGTLFGRMEMIRKSSREYGRETNSESSIDVTVASNISQPSPEPEVQFVKYTVTSLMANLYEISRESGEARKVLEIPIGTVLQVFDEYKEYYICAFGDQDGDFCIEKRLVEEGVFYVNPENGIDLRFVLPDAEYELLFASENNITGHSMCPPIPMLEVKTGEMLKAAADQFAADGYKMKIYDSYRPKSAQYELYAFVQDPRFIADPYINNSFHQLGRAVDISLIDAGTGTELRMPTEMHTFNEQASRYSREFWTEEERQNVDYMTSVMEHCGFRTIETEWWHFENSESGNYMDPYLDYESLSLISREISCEKYPQF